MRRLKMRQFLRLIGMGRLSVVALSAAAVVLTAPVAADGALPVVYSSVVADA
jgi:hypothetical protein